MSSWRTQPAVRYEAGTTLVCAGAGLGTWLVVRYGLLSWIDPVAAQGLDDVVFVIGGVVFGTVHTVVLVTTRHGVRVLLFNAAVDGVFAATAAGLAAVAASAQSILLHVDRPLSAAIRGERLVFVLHLLTRGGSQRFALVVAVVAAPVATAFLQWVAFVKSRFTVGRQGIEP